MPVGSRPARPMLGVDRAHRDLAVDDRLNLPNPFKRLALDGRRRQAADMRGCDDFGSFANSIVGI
jgi:hypothetical protein